MNAPALREFNERIRAIECVVEEFHGVDEVEHQLVDFLRFIESGKLDQSIVERRFLELALGPPGGNEILEFTLRTLRWPATKTALRQIASEAADFRTVARARQVLEVYEVDWPGGEVYRFYREAN